MNHFSGFLKTKKTNNILLVSTVFFAFITSLIFINANHYSSANNGNVNTGEVIARVKDRLKTIDFNNSPAVAKILEPSRYSTVDKTNKKLEIQKATGRKFQDITDDEVLAALRTDNLELSSLSSSFRFAQDNLENSLLSKIIAGSKLPAGYTGDANSYYENLINNNAEKLLIGIAYIYRLYNFEMGNQNIAEALLFNPSQYGKDVSSIDWLINIGSLKGDELKIVNNQKTFKKIFASVTNASNIPQFLEESRNKFMNGATLADWYTLTAKTKIIETPSKEKADATYKLYDKLTKDSARENYILPLLTSKNIYAISNPLTITLGDIDTYVNRDLATNTNEYTKELKNFYAKLEETAEEQQSFVDFWYRTAKPEVRDRLNPNHSIVVLDSLRRATSNTSDTASKQWSTRAGNKASLGVSEFLSPMNLYGAFTFADAQAEGDVIRLFIVKALESRGKTAYTHELTHILEKYVWLNNNGVRDGLDVEFYAMGLYESNNTNDPIYNLNLIFDRKNNPNRYSNSSPNRFTTPDDLKSYMHNSFDVLYTLDYAEAQASLSKDKITKKNLFNKTRQVEDQRRRFNPGNGRHTVDLFENITEDEADKLKTINDLIENNIVSGRYEFKGRDTVGQSESNGYYTIPLFTPNYSAVQNENGVSGDIAMRKQFYEILAEYGYYSGVVPYISNQYKSEATAENKILSDAFILNKIFAGKYANITEFKKAMFAERINKITKLKPVTINIDVTEYNIDSYDKISELMNKAIDSDLKNNIITGSGFRRYLPSETAVEKLKQAIYKAYMNSTDDFRSTIYREDIANNNSSSVNNNADINNNSTPNANANANNDNNGSSSSKPSSSTIKGEEIKINPSVDNHKHDAKNLTPNTGVSKGNDNSIIAIVIAGLSLLAITTFFIFWIRKKSNK